MKRILATMLALVLSASSLHAGLVGIQGPRLFLSEGSGNVPVASQYPLEIMYPRAAGTAPDLDSTNRAFFAYTGLTYEVPIAIGWGTFPYSCVVSGGETGKFSVVEYTMANGDTGLKLRYTNPQVSDDSSITLTCEDAALDSDSVSYSITVGTSGWYFLDSTNDGSGDSGTFAAPFDTLAQAYSGMAANARLYIRAGSYTLAGITTENPALGTGFQNTELRINWNQSSSGATWIAYPGDARPVINYGYDHDARDPSLGYVDPAPRVRMTGGSIYVAGMSLSDAMIMFFQMERSGRHGAVVWDNVLNGIGPGCGCGDNASSVMYVATYGGGGSPNTQVYGDIIMSNEVSESIGGSVGPGAFKLYSMLKPIIQGNYMYNAMGDEAIAIKADVSQFMVLQNRFGTTSGLGGNMDTHNEAFGEETFGDIAYSLFDADSARLEISTDRVDDFIGRIDVYRSTFLSSVDIEAVQTVDGPYVFTKDVFQNSDSGQTPWPCIVDTSIADATRVTLDDNLCAASGLVDSNGDLLDPENVGIYGHKLQ